MAAGRLTPERKALALLLDKFASRFWHTGEKRLVHWRDPDFVSEQFVGQYTTELLDAANLMREKCPQLVWTEQSFGYGVDKDKRTDVSSPAR
jgi:hypothetical protein